jgi:hypothetical protein
MYGKIMLIHPTGEIGQPSKISYTVCKNSNEIQEDSIARLFDDIYSAKLSCHKIYVSEFPSVWEREVD